MTAKRTLYYLDELSGYKITKRDFDVRCWKMQGLDKRLVGIVEDLVVDKAAGCVAYLEVAVNKIRLDDGLETYKLEEGSELHELLEYHGYNHVMVSLDMVELDTDNHTVHATGKDTEVFGVTRRFSRGIGYHG